MDIYLVSSEELDSASVALWVVSDTIAVRRLDDLEHVWAGDYELTCAMDSVVVQACASDIRGNDTCVAMKFSATFIAAAVGGMARSLDGRLRLTISPRGLGRDSFVLILPGETAQSNPPKEGPGFPRWHIPTAPESGTELPSYRLSPDGILTGSPALLECSFAGTNLEGEPPDHLYIEREGSGPLESFVDPESRIVSAVIWDMGTYRLSLGGEGASRLVDPRFMRVDQNFPNPFSPATTIRFETRDHQRVRVTVYDVMGREVSRLLDGNVYPGSHEILWEGRTDQGQPAAPGVYFYRVETENTACTKKMLRVQ